MIERKFVKERLKEYQIREYVANTLKNVGHSETRLQRTPLGEKIIISASRPGLVVGRKGENIKKLTNTLKNKFGLENPQIEIEEVKNPNLDAQIVAERIASTLERFGLQKFKGIGHKTLKDVMDAGALGVEIIMSGKVPSQRARSWRFYKGYLKKSGDICNEIQKAVSHAGLKTGAVGIKVSIMPPTIKLPDDVNVIPDIPEIEEENIDKSKEIKEEPKESKEEVEETKEKKEEKKEKKTTKRKKKTVEEKSDK